MDYSLEVPEWAVGKFNVQKTIKFLSKHPEIVKIVDKKQRLEVVFKNTIREYWHYDEHVSGHRCLKFPIENVYTLGEIPIRLKYGRDPLNPDYDILKNHFVVRSSDLEKSGFINKRILVNVLIKKLVAEGWVDIEYPKSILSDFFDNIKNFDFYKHQSSIIRFFYNHGYNSTHVEFIQHFSKNKCAIEKWGYPHRLWRPISYLANYNSEITRANIVKNLSGKVLSPNFYRSIFIQWCDIYGKSMLDLEPSVSRYLACSLAGGKYYFFKKRLDDERYDDLKEFLIEKGHNGHSNILKNNYDIILLNKFVTMDLDKIISLVNIFKQKAKSLLVFIDFNDAEKAKKILKPRRQLRINTKLYAPKQDNYLFIIEQK